MISGAAIARLLLYLGAMTVVGEAALGRRAVEQRQTRLAAWSLLVTAVLSLLLLQARDMELEPNVDAWRSLLLGTTWGRHWCVLAGVVLAGAAASVRRVSRLVALLLAAGLAVAMGGLGHAAADDQYPVLVRAVDAVHLLATGAWIGGLGLVAWYSRRASASTSPDGAENYWPGFSRVATIAAPVAVVTGLLSGWRRVTAAQVGDAGEFMLPPLSSLVTAEYGQLLLIKLGLVLVMLGLGQMHRRRVLREHAPSVTAIRFELALAFAVLAVTGVLTGTAPPGE